ncbi:MAG: hypothetical protein CL878_11075 [Dehalococcoidia bacterium]|nr:hypothetical protein [Dehalococcoidia bacterium]
MTVSTTAVIVDYRTPASAAQSALAVSRSRGVVVNTVVVRTGVLTRAGTGAPPLPATVREVRLARNGGYGWACNRGAHAAEGDYLAFLNADTLVHSDTISVLVDWLEQTPHAGIAGPRVLRGDGRLERSWGREPLPARSWSGSALGDLCSGRLQIGGRGEAVRASPRRVDWLSGVMFVCRRAVWEALEGFDERFFLYFEDVDYCRRARAAAWTIWYVPTARVVHVGGGAQRRPALRTIGRQSYRESQTYYWQKHYGRTAAAGLRLVRWLYRWSGWRTSRLKRGAGTPGWRGS